MEKVITQSKQVVDRTHYFYCDDCGREIGHSRESIEGWYDVLGELELRMYTPKGWYVLDKCLCGACKEKYLTNFYETIESLDFKLD